MANNQGAIHIEIKNLAEIRRAFRMSPQLMTDELDKAITKTAFGLMKGQVMAYNALGIRVITRGLISSIQMGYQRQGRLRAEVGPNAGGRGVYYAGYVHDGTSRMRARPFLTVAIEDEQRNIDDVFTKAVDNVLSKVGKMV